jgi:hypothetical protein
MREICTSGSTSGEWKRSMVGYSGTGNRKGQPTRKATPTPPRHSSTLLRSYSREKTLADRFKYRNKIGLDTAVEALKRYKQQGRIDADALMHYAQTCRVANVMRPYLEAVL